MLCPLSARQQSYRGAQSSWTQMACNAHGRSDHPERQGIKEGGVIRLIKTLIISRPAYSIPYIRRKHCDLANLDILIRKVCKQELGLPRGISTLHLEFLGVDTTAR